MVRYVLNNYTRREKIHRKLTLNQNYCVGIVTLHIFPTPTIQTPPKLERICRVFF